MIRMLKRAQIAHNLTCLRRAQRTIDTQNSLFVRLQPYILEEDSQSSVSHVALMYKY